MNNRNYYISILKLLAACFVVFIHVPASGSLGVVLECIARFAVPFFFLVSGYFAYQANVHQIRRRLKKIAILWLVGNALFFLWQCYMRFFITHKSVSSYIRSVFTFKTLADSLFISKNPFSAHLWYLLAMVLLYVFWLMYLMFYKGHKISYKPLYVLGVCAYLIYIVFSLKAKGVGLEVSMYIYRNSLLTGLPMFALGIFLHQYQERILENYRYNGIKALCILVMGTALSLLQRFEIGETEMPVAMVAVITGLLLWAVKKPSIEIKKEKTRSLLDLAEPTATVIYLLHPLVNRIIKAYAQSVPLFEKLSAEKVLYPFIVLLISFLIGLGVALIILLLRKRKKDQF